MPTGRTFTLGAQCPLTRLTTSKVVSAIAYANPQEPNQNWGSNCPNSPSSSVFNCRSYRSSIGYWFSVYSKNMSGDYVVGDSVISRVYYVEGLGHNMFSVGQFCDSDLEVAFRKHSCYVRDTDGLKEQYHGLWMSFKTLDLRIGGTINDLAKKGLIRHFSPKTSSRTHTAERWLSKVGNRTLIEAARTMLIFSKAPIVTTLHLLSIIQDAPSPIHSPSSSALQSPSLHQDVAAESTIRKDNPFAPVDNDPFINVFAPEPSSEASSSGDLSSAESPYVTQNTSHLRHSPSSSALQSPSSHQGVAVGSTIIADNPFSSVDNNPFVNVFAPEPSSEASSSGDVCSAESTHVSQPHHHLGK
ncbi:hypothetical protein Tco_1493489 [Tanacetum coccineum]